MKTKLIKRKQRNPAINWWPIFILFMMVGVNPILGQTITVTTNSSWSALPSTPTSTTAIIIGNGVTLTVDVSNAVAGSVQIGLGTTSMKGKGTLVFNAGSALTVSNNVVVGDNAYTGTLNMSNGGTLTCSTIGISTSASPAPSFVLTSGTIVYTGTMTTVPITDYNNLSIATGGTMTMPSGTSLNISGNFSVNGTFNASTSTLNFNGTTSQTITGASTLQFYNVNIGNSSSTVTFGQNTNLTTLNVYSGGTVSAGSSKVLNGTLLSGNGTVQVTKTGTLSDFPNQYVFTTYSLDNLTVEFAGSAHQVNKYSSFPFLTINNVSGVTLDAVTTVTSRLILKNGSLDNSSFDLTLNSGSMLVITMGSVTKTPVLPGTINVLINSTGNHSLGYELPSASNKIFNLIVDAGSNYIDLGNSIIVEGTLTLTSGYLTLGTSNITLGNSGSFSGGSTSSYLTINSTGRVTAPVGTGGITFPIGYNPYLPIKIISPSTENFSVGVASGITNYLGANYTSEAVNVTWDVKPSATVSNVNIILQWNNTNELTLFNHNSCCIATRIPATSLVWNLTQTGAAATNTFAGIYTRTTTIPTLNAGSVYQFGVLNSGISALPVSLTDFRVNKLNNDAHLEWTTASEINNDKFEIEASSDGGLWIKAGEVKGHGNTNRTTNYTYDYLLPANTNSTFYFRLRQVDFNGQFEYSPVRTLRPFESYQEIEVSPNPVSSMLKVNLPSYSGKCQVEIFDYTGKTVYKNSGEFNENVLHVENLKPGFYILNLVTDEATYRTTFLKDNN